VLRCWNTGDDVGHRVVYTAWSTANVQCLGPSEETRSKDDLDCLYSDDTFAPTAEPTLSPILSFNCTAYDEPVQVLQIYSDVYGVVILDLDAGEYEMLWVIDWFEAATSTPSAWTVRARPRRRDARAVPDAAVAGEATQATRVPGA